MQRSRPSSSRRARSSRPSSSNARELSAELERTTQAAADEKARLEAELAAEQDARRSRPRRTASRLTRAELAKLEATLAREHSEKLREKVALAASRSSVARGKAELGARQATADEKRGSRPARVRSADAADADAVEAAVRGAHTAADALARKSGSSGSRRAWCGLRGGARAGRRKGRAHRRA